MTPQEINEKYQQIFVTPNVEAVFQFDGKLFGYGMGLAVVTVIIMLIHLLWLRKKDQKAQASEKSYSLLRFSVSTALILMAPVVLTCLFSGLNYLSDMGLAQRQTAKIARAQIEQWKQEVAQPYLKSLPARNHPLIYLKIDPEIETEVSGLVTFGSGDISSESELLTPMVMSYQDGGRVITRTERFPSEMDLSASDKPYVSYRVLQEPLGVADPIVRMDKLCGGLFCNSNDYRSPEYPVGSFDYIVHLPKDYTFTEIK